MERRQTFVLNYTSETVVLVLVLSYITMFCPCNAESPLKDENAAVKRLNSMNKLPPRLMSPYHQQQTLPYFHRQRQPLHPLHPLGEQFYEFKRHNRFRRSNKNAVITTTKKSTARSLNNPISKDSSESNTPNPKKKPKSKAASKSNSNSDTESKADNSGSSESDQTKNLPNHENRHKKFPANNGRKKVIKRNKKAKSKNEDNSAAGTAVGTSETTESTEDTEPSTDEGRRSLEQEPQHDKPQILDNESDSHLKNSEESGGDNQDESQLSSETTASSATGRSLDHNNPPLDSSFGTQDAGVNPETLVPEKDLSGILDSAFDKFWKHSETEQKKETFSIGSLPPGIPANFFGDAETHENAGAVVSESKKSEEPGIDRGMALLQKLQTGGW